MAQYLPLPDGSFVTVREGETPLQAYERATKEYPEAFGITPPAPKEGVGAAFQGGLESLLSRARTGVEAIFDPEEAARRGLERGEAIGQEFAPGASLQRVKDVYAERGLLPAAGEAISQVPTALAEQFPNIAATLGSAKLGAMAGAPLGPVGSVVGGVAGAAAPSLLQLFGSNIERQAAEQAEAGQRLDISRGAALGAAVPGAALEVAATFIPLGRSIVGKLLGPQAREVMERGTAEAREALAQESLLKVLGKGTAVGALAEIPTEVTQQMLERLQAGLPITSDDALAEYGEAAYGAGLVGGPFGAVGRVGQRGVARGEIAEEERQAKAEEARLAAEKEAEYKASPQYKTELLQKINANKAEITNLREVATDKTVDKDVVKEAKTRIRELERETQDLVAELKEVAPTEGPTLQGELSRRAAQRAGVSEVPLFTTEEAAEGRGEFELLPTAEEQEAKAAERAQLEQEFDRENQVLLREISDINQAIEDTPAYDSQRLAALAQRKRMMVKAQEDLSKQAKAQNITLRRPPENLQRMFEEVQKVQDQLKDEKLTPEKRMVLQSEDYKLRSQILDQTDAFRMLKRESQAAQNALAEARKSQNPDRIEAASNKVQELRSRELQLMATPDLFSAQNLLRVEQQNKAQKELEEDQGVKSFIGNLYDRITDYKKRVAENDQRKAAIEERRTNYEQLANKTQALLSSRGVELLGVTPDRRQQIEQLLVEGSLPPTLAKELFGIENIELETIRNGIMEISARRDARTEAFLNGDVEFLTNRAEQQKLVAQINALENEIRPFQKIIADINAKKAEGLTEADKKQRADARRAINKLDQQIAPLRNNLGANAILTREGAAAVKDEVRLSLLGQLLIRQKQIAQERTVTPDLFTAEDVAERVFTGQYDENGQPIYTSKVLGAPALELQGQPEERPETDPELRYKQDNNVLLSYFNDAIYTLQRGTFGGVRPDEDPFEIDRNRRLGQKLEAVENEIAANRERLQTPGIDPRLADELEKRITTLQGRSRIIRAGMTEGPALTDQDYFGVVDEANNLADTYSENAVAEINAARAAKGLPPLEGEELRKYYASLPPGDAPRTGTTPSLLDFFRGKFGEFIDRASYAKASIRSAQNQVDALERERQALSAQLTGEQTLEQGDIEEKISDLANQISSIKYGLAERGVPETGLPEGILSRIKGSIAFQRPFAKIGPALDVLREGLDDVTAIAKGEQTELQKANDSLPVQPFEQVSTASALLPETRKSELRALAKQLEEIEKKLEGGVAYEQQQLKRAGDSPSLAEYIETLKAEKETLEKISVGVSGSAPTLPALNAAELDYLFSVAEPDGPIFDYYPTPLAKEAAKGVKVQAFPTASIDKRISILADTIPKLEKRLEEIKGVSTVEQLEARLAELKKKPESKATAQDIKETQERLDRLKLEEKRGEVKAEIEKIVASLPISQKTKDISTTLFNTLKDLTGEVNALGTTLSELKAKPSGYGFSGLSQTAEITAQIKQTQSQIDNFKDTIAKIKRALVALDKTNQFTYSQSERTAFLAEKTKQRDTFEAALEVADARVNVFKELLEFAKNEFPAIQKLSDQYYKKRAEFESLLSRKDKDTAAKDVESAKAKLDKRQKELQEAQVTETQKKGALARTTTPEGKAKAKAALAEAKQKLDEKQFAFANAQADLAEALRQQKNSITLEAREKAKRAVETAGEKLLTKQEKASPFTRLVLLDREHYRLKYEDLPQATTDEQKQSIQNKISNVLARQKKIEDEFESTYKNAIAEFDIILEFPSDARAKAADSIAKANKSFSVLVDGANAEINSLLEKLAKEPTVNAPELRKQYREAKQKLDAMRTGTGISAADYKEITSLIDRLADEIIRTPPTKMKAYQKQVQTLRGEIAKLEQEHAKFVAERELIYASGYAKYVNELADAVTSALPRAVNRQKRLQNAVARFANAQKMQQTRTDKEVDALVARTERLRQDVKESQTRLIEAERQAEAKRTIGTITVKGKELPVIKVKREPIGFVIDREPSTTLVEVEESLLELAEELKNPELTKEQLKSKQGSYNQLRGVRYRILMTEDPSKLSNELAQIRDDVRKEKNQNKKRSLRKREETLVNMLAQVGITDVVSVKQDGKKAMRVVSNAKVTPWYETWTHANGTPVEAALKEPEAPNYTLQSSSTEITDERGLIKNARAVLNQQLEEITQRISTLEAEKASKQSIRAAKAAKTNIEQQLNELSLRKAQSEMSKEEIDALVKEAALTEGNYSFSPEDKEKKLTTKRVRKGKLVTEYTDNDYLQASGPSVTDLKDLPDLLDNFNVKPTFDPRIGDVPLVALDYDAAEPILAEIKKKVGANNIKFAFYRNVEALPKDIKDQIIAQGLAPVANGIKGGVNVDGTVFVIVENHSSLLDLEKTLTHEFVGHYSFESLLGPEGMAKLAKRVTSSFGSVMKLAEKLGVVDKAQATYVSGMKAGLTPAQAEVKALKEIIAYTTEAQVNESFLKKASRWIKEMIGAFRARLRELGLADLSKLNTNDLFYMIRQAKRQFEEGKPLAYQAADGTVSFRGAVAQVPRTGIEAMLATKGKNFDRIKSNVMGLAARVKFFDRFAALEALTKRGVELGKISALKAFDVMYFSRMADQRHTMTAQIATGGAPRLVTKNGELMYESGDGPSLKDVSEALKDSGILPNEVEVAFTAYAIARRASRVGVEKLDFSGKKVTKKDVQEALAKYGNNAAFKKAYDLYQDFNGQMLDFVVSTGAMSKDKAAELKRYRDYVPFYRIKDGQAVLELFGEKPVTIGDIKNQPYLRELVGGEEGILPIFTSALQNTTLLADMALKNMAARNSAYVLRDLGVAEIHKVKGGGVGPSGTDIIRFKRDGELYWARIDTKMKDTLFGDIPTELVVTGMEGLKVIIPDGVRLLGMPANWLRKFVTRDPRYAIRQIFRDSMSAALTTGANFVPVVQTLKDMSTMKKSGVMETLQKRFILGGQVITGASDDMAKILQQLASGKPGWEQAMAKLDEWAMMGDAATRVSMYNSFIKQGLTEREATFATMEAMNFGRRGISPTVFYANMMIPFFNAGLQGIDVLYRAFTGQMPNSERLKVKQKLLARGAMMALMTMAYAAMMEDEEEYKNANPDERYNNWFVPTPVGVLRVPIPFEAGLLFKGIPEGVYRMAFTDDKNADVLKALKDLAMRSVPIDLPTAIKPLVELNLNKSFFTDREIVDASMPEDPKYQYRPQTPEVIKMFGAVGLSPAQVEYFIKGYTGSMLVSLLRVFDPVLGGEIVKPDMRITDVPVLGGLFQPKDAGGLINAAYNSTRAIQAAQRTYNRLLQENPDEADKYLRENINNIGLASFAGEFRQEMGELTQAERSIRGSKTMTGEEKREQLDNIRKMKIWLASSFNDIKRQTELQAARGGYQ